MLPRGTWIRHFALGVLTRDRALRFAAVHLAHHLRIVAEIHAAVAAGMDAGSCPRADVGDREAESNASRARSSG